MRRFALAVVLAACGRLHFGPELVAPPGDGSGDGARDAPGMLTEAYFKASNTDAFDNFGANVAVSGDGTTLAVGAVDESSNATGIDGNQVDNTDTNSGAVYLFVRAGATWVQQAYVKASDTAPLALFGSGLALSSDGNTLAVGALGDASDTGAAFVFTRAGATWSQQAVVTASNASTGDQFGFSVALSSDGNTLAVGATSEASAATGIDGNQADNSAAMSGAAYVFTRTGTTWSQQAYVKASNTGAMDQFGFAVALAEDGNTLAVGANGEASAATGVDGNQADNSAPQSGAVYVFTRAGTTWAQQAYLKATPAIAGDFFGEALACSGDTVAVGDPGNDAVANAGAVVVFARANATWSQQAMLFAPIARDNDQLGAGIALAGDTLVAGAPFEPSGSPGIDGDEGDASAPDAGAAFWFTRTGTTWTFTHYLKATDPGMGADFGVGLAIGADGTIAIGASHESSGTTGVDSTPTGSASDSGAVYSLFRD